MTLVDAPDLKTGFAPICWGTVDRRTQGRRQSHDNTCPYDRTWRRLCDPVPAERIETRSDRGARARFGIGRRICRIWADAQAATWEPGGGGRNSVGSPRHAANGRVPAGATVATVGPLPYELVGPGQGRIDDVRRESTGGDNRCDQHFAGCTTSCGRSRIEGLGKSRRRQDGDCYPVPRRVEAKPDGPVVGERT